jgi:hypothetical protein
MKQDRRAQGLTLAVLAVVLAAGVARKARTVTEPEPADPQNSVYAMLNAARAGDVRAYLASYAGPIADTLRQTLAETSERDFAKYLRETNAAIKGVAVSDPQVSGQTAIVRVEYVYQDRNEAQTMGLERGREGWKITRADNDERLRTAIPYGTPVK